MKKIMSLLLMITLCVLLVSCGKQNESGNNKTIKDSSLDEEKDKEETQNISNVLVVYFSATGNTKAVAESIADEMQADIYEIIPEKPYTDADLDYNDKNSRSTLEMNDSSARPEISGTVDNFEQYDTVFLGYPIWWGEAPRILDTFVEKYDFKDKTVIPFCTSASSSIDSSAATLEKLAGSGNWMEGQRFSGSESQDKVKEWTKQFE